MAAEGVVVTEALDGRGGERGIRVDVLSWVSGVMIILV